jgi:hypothetical protein
MRIRDLEAQFQEDVSRLGSEARSEVRRVKDGCEAQIGRAVGLMNHEINVCTAIKDKMLGENKWQAEKLRKFATILRIPRLHFEYIEKHGIDEFVDFCEGVVKRERAVLEKGKAQQLQAELRGDFQTYKLKKYGPGLELSERTQLQDKEVKIEKPFAMALDADLRREDHKDHKKHLLSPALRKQERESKKIMEQLAKINWLKN